MTTTTENTKVTAYDLEGQMLEVCTCDAICPCWVGQDPDGGTCDGLITWAIKRGTVEGVDVSDRMIGVAAFIPGNPLQGNWRAVVYVDDRCTEQQQKQLLKVFTGQLGGPIADLASLIGEVTAVERIEVVSHTIEEGKGVLKLGDVIEARITPFTGATGATTTLNDTAFSSIPGSPAYVGTAELFRRQTGNGLADVSVTGKNSVQGFFHFTA